MLSEVFNELTTDLLSVDKLSSERIKLVMEHIWKLQEFCNSMAKLQTDGYEYAYLKAMVLFSPGTHANSFTQLLSSSEKASIVAFE